MSSVSAKTALFLIFLSICLSHFTMVFTLKAQQTKYYFRMRNEYDQRCVALLNNDLVLTPNCDIGEAAWESSNVSDSQSVQNVWLRNYYYQHYLSFNQGAPIPVLSGDPGSNSRWTFQLIHNRNRRYPNDRSYWNINYYVVKNLGTGLCLMVNGDVMRQKGCDPAKPEHISFESIPFNPNWKESPEVENTETSGTTISANVTLNVTANLTISNTTNQTKPTYPSRQNLIKKKCSQ